MMNYKEIFFKADSEALILELSPSLREELNYFQYG